MKNTTFTSYGHRIIFLTVFHYLFIPMKNSERNALCILNYFEYSQAN